MEERLARYYELKQQQKRLEEELEQVKTEILQACPAPGGYTGDCFKMTVTWQERREYDDNRLYNALADKELWRLMSRADTGKISSLLQLDILTEKNLEGTYEIRRIPIVRVQKR